MTSELTHIGEPSRTGEPDTPIRGDLPSPRIFIPWGPGDNGVRGAAGTVPASVIDYYWPGIHVYLPDGSEALGHLLPLDQTSTVVIDIANAGDDGAWVEPALYWAEPSVGFGPPHLHRGPVVGSPTGIWVEPGLTQAFPITVHPTVPPLKPPHHPHFCLIAVVSTIGSSPDHSWNPFADGHYAQHNLDVHEVDADTDSAVAPLWIVNPFPTDAVVEVSIHAAPSERLHWFADRYRTDPAELPAQDLQLLTIDGRGPGRPVGRILLELEGRGRRICHALVSGAKLEPGQFSVVEVRSTVMHDDSDRKGRGERYRGSYGVAIFKQ